MKYLTEYRDAKLVRSCLAEIKRINTRPWKIMEICGGQTHGLVKHGLLQLLPENIEMVHGPGCPVCVTPIELIDEAIALAEDHRVILCSFGDMLRVPGSDKSLLQAKAEGADVRIVYSPLDAVRIASENPGSEVVFFAVGFETTAPANALSVVHAHAAGISNYSLLTSHVLVPPAMEAILSDEETRIDGFLAAGHVCAIMGLEEYYPIAEKYQVPIVATGFEPVDLIEGILMVVKQLEEGRHDVENQYARVVESAGNVRAKQTIGNVFEVSDRAWRGLGTIPGSGYEIKGDYHKYDARKKFNLNNTRVHADNGCLAGDILKGILKPVNCPHFGKGCTPEKPMGAPMVSSEGACAAYYHYGNTIKAEEDVVA